jgi:hypothetical protein
MTKNAYKVVRVHDGCYFSSNYSLDDIIEKSKNPEDSNIIEYKMNTVIYPVKSRPVLFVCATLEEAEKAKYFHSKMRQKTYLILKGRATDLKAAKSIVEFKDGTTIFVPYSFKTHLCSSFKPLEIVTSKCRSHLSKE